jgi:hypothetical protein
MSDAKLNIKSNFILSQKLIQVGISNTKPPHFHLVDFYSLLSSGNTDTLSIAASLLEYTKVKQRPFFGFLSQRL